MSATTTEQEAAQAEQESALGDSPEQSERTVEERLERLEDAFAEHLCDSFRELLADTVYRTRLKDLSRKVDELASQPQPMFGELVTADSDNVHMRISTKQTAKGFQFETAVSVDGPDATDVRQRVEQLLYQTNDIARAECARLEMPTDEPMLDPNVSDSQNDGWKQ